MAYTYHYCSIRNTQHGTVYSSGLYKTDDKIKFGQPYELFTNKLKTNFGLAEEAPIDFVVTSLTLIDDET